MMPSYRHSWFRFTFLQACPKSSSKFKVKGQTRPPFHSIPFQSSPVQSIPSFHSSIPFHRIHTPCCDGCGTTQCTEWEQSDSYFIYCLRPFGDVRQPPEGCFRSSQEYRNTSSVNFNDGLQFDFSQSTVLGLNNPQILSGLEDAYSVSAVVDASVVQPWS